MNVFEIGARISLDTTEYLKSLGQASKETSGFASGIKNVLSTTLKAGAAALGTAAAGVTAFVKESVSAYGEYEQLYGGLVTLYEDLAWDVEQNANKAFKTAGLSINEYMETAMSFSASLNQSLQRTEGNIARSADLTDLAITDMADNANKMGTAMENIQTAYAGFAKQNYTMLDNLKLGYGGTKTEMERLLADAEKLTGVHYDIENFSDIIEGIHVIQENLGITGTTAKEASETIQGSISSMKAAWQNLKLEVSKEDGNIGEAFETLGETAGAVFDNIMPRIEKSLDGIGDLIVKAAPAITQGITKMIPEVIPPLIKASTSLVKAFVSSIPEIAASIPDLATTIFDEVVKPMGNEIFALMPDWLGDNIKGIFASIKDFGGSIDFSRLKESVMGVAESLDPLVEKLSGGVTWAFENVLKPLGTWLANDAIPTALDFFSATIGNITNTLEILEPIGKAVWQEFLSPLFSGIGDLAVGTLQLFGNVLSDMATTFKGFDTVGFIDDIKQGNFAEDWKAGMEVIGETLDSLSDDIDEFFGVNGPAQIWNSVWQRIGGAIFDAKEIICTSIDDIIDGIDKLIDKIIGLPQKWVDFWSGFGEYLASDRAERHMIPAYGDGGRVTRPTLAIVGEKEPETIVPDSKRNQFGGSNINITINVEGGISSDYDVERIAHKLSELNVLQTRAIGGTGF